MTKAELLDLIYSWENLELLIRKLENQAEHIPALMEIALHSNDPKSWRAAWVADKIHDYKPEMISPYLEEIINQLIKETNNSKKRQFLKLISLNEIPKEFHPVLIDYCLNCFTSASQPVAVRVHAMQILFNISQKVPPFKPELLSIIEYETELHPTAGIRSRGKKLAKMLHQQI